VHVAAVVVELEVHDPPTVTLTRQDIENLQGFVTQVQFPLQAEAELEKKHWSFASEQVPPLMPRKLVAVQLQFGMAMHVV